MQKFCFQVDGETICIPIPVLLVEWKPGPDPDPGPLRRILDNWIVQRPDPDPWQKELPIIATVSALADLAVTSDLKEALQEVVRVQTDRIAGQLPDGATFDISKGRQAAAAR